MTIHLNDEQFDDLSRVDYIWTLTRNSTSPNRPTFVN